MGQRSFWFAASVVLLLLGGAAVLGLTGTTVQAQTVALPAASAPMELPPAVSGAAPAAVPRPPQPCCPPFTGYTPTPGAMPAPGIGTEPGAAAANAGDFRSVTSGAGFGTNSVVGYIDSAIPITQMRIRYDAGFNMNRPDRAEFFYPEWRELSFHPHGVNGGGGAFFDSKARGPAVLPSNVNYQEATAYLEGAYNKRFSAFVEVPLRFVDFRNPQEDDPESEAKRNPANQPNPGSRFFPEPGARGNEPGAANSSSSGLSDINLGFKYALLADPDQYLTFQLRAYVPTGDARQGLGTGHVSLEPSLLYYQRLSDRLTFEGELRDWIPIDGGAAAGNVLRYGVGMSYEVYHCGNFRVTPVTEFVGWTVLSGFDTFFGTIDAGPTPGLDLPLTHGVENAAGQTIINAKIGVRTYFGEHSDVYIGWGHALTGDHWYTDIVRAEYRLRF